MNSGLKLFVRDALGNRILKSPRLRRFAWRTGRWLYCAARGEQRIDAMRLDGEFDLQLRTVAANRAEPRFVAFDVGANQGDWTLQLVNLFEADEGRPDRLDAHVFEPVPETRDRLFARLNANHRTNIRINPTAASDKTGTFDMIVMSESGGTNSLVYDKATAKKAKGFVSVPLTTLDLYCASVGIDRINIVKSDTEGHDLSVMRGATELLSAGRIDVFQFEYNHRWIGARAFLKDVFELVDGLPYHLGRVMPSSVELFDAWHPELERYYQSNYVLVRDEVLPWLNVTRGRFDKSGTYA